MWRPPIGSTSESACIPSAQQRAHVPVALGVTEPMPTDPTSSKKNETESISPRYLVAGVLFAAVALVGLIIILRRFPVHPSMIWAGSIFIFGSVAVVLGTVRWLSRVDQHLLLRSEEKIQNKDAVVIGAFFTLLLLLAYCIVAATAAMLFPDRAGAAVLLALTWALASATVGGAFGFLLGHPRRLTEEKTDRAGMSGLLRTGLDDMVDWLVKGLTTVLLVQAGPILVHLDDISRGMARALVVPGANDDTVRAAAAFAQPLIVAFTLLGALATCLVTRIYLTGALGRADRTTTGAFSRVGLDLGEVLLLVNAQRFLTSRNLPPGNEVLAVAKELSALTLNDLHSVQEFAMWAKAKSMLGEYEEALKGYEKALAECDCDPALLLDYGVALHAADKKEAALVRLKLAYEHLARATDPETRRNVYKSLTFELLHEPRNFDQVIKLVDEYEDNRGKTADQSSGGLLVNKACALGQKFKWLAKESGLIEDVPPLPIKVTIQPSLSSWATTHPELRKVYEQALDAVRKAVEVDPTWKKHLQLLLKRGDSVKSDRPDIEALEVFERFDDFRLLLELPPFSEATKEQKVDKSAGETEQKNQGDPKDDVSTETNKGTRGTTESP